MLPEDEEGPEVSEPGLLRELRVKVADVVKVSLPLRRDPLLPAPALMLALSMRGVELGQLVIKRPHQAIARCIADAAGRRRGCQRLGPCCAQARWIGASSGGAIASNTATGVWINDRLCPSQNRMLMIPRADGGQL